MAHGDNWSYLLIYLFQTWRQQDINIFAYELRRWIGAEFYSSSACFIAEVKGILQKH